MGRPRIFVYRAVVALGSPHNHVRAEENGGGFILREL